MKCDECGRSNLTRLTDVGGIKMCVICYNKHFPPPPVQVGPSVVGFPNTGIGELEALMRRVFRDEICRWGDESPSTCMMLDIIIEELGDYQDLSDKLEEEGAPDEALKRICAILRRIYEQQSTISVNADRHEFSELRSFVKRTAEFDPDRDSAKDLLDLIDKARDIEESWLGERP